MAGLGFLARCFFIFLLFSASVSDQTLKENPTTTTFDVSSAIEKTRNAVAFTCKSLDEKAADQVKESFSGPKVAASTSTGDPAVAASTSATGFSVQMQSRDILDESSYKDYTDLLRARLKQDAVHIKALKKRLQGAIKKHKRAKKKRKSTSKGLNVSVESGENYDSGGYIAQVSIGSPPKTQLMTIDTGSDVTWVQCQPCRKCFKQYYPIFDPSSSSTYSPISCQTPECKSLDKRKCNKRKGLCRYSFEYGDNSTSVGDFAFETLTFGNTHVNNIAVGCGTKNMGRFKAVSGILGLGRGNLSLPNQLKVTNFSYCLVDSYSKASTSLEFGKNIEQNDGTVFIPLIDNPKTPYPYYVGLTGLSVGEEQVPIPPGTFDISKDGPGGVVVDSGTSHSLFPNDVYNSFRDIFKKQTSHLTSTAPPANVSYFFDTCYAITNVDSVQVPLIKLHFSASASLTLLPKHYLLPVDSNGNFCFGFTRLLPGVPMSIIGSAQMQGTRVIYDIANSRIGFAPQNC